MNTISKRASPKRKFIGLLDDTHTEFMRIARDCGAAANEVMVAMLQMIDRNQLVARLKSERAEKEAVRAKLRTKQKEILTKLSQLKSEDLDRLLEQL